ncbi:hypothetical protein AGRA3207_002865 [Actinomadura graeca]|uniref:Uncharacterized protein n=1 Tax=Actinomadura graeca TaxID=2750812 RepID=A0ABX8QTI6_9ACTN|nr:hypothetical protein [Actinomadura graeca]QXJ21948.1 hypothetical protein AGRA3207_002865 [Actinomadura graeca]
MGLLSRIKSLVAEVPVAYGRATKELAQSVELTGRRVEHRAGQSFFGRLVGRITGRDRKAQIQTDRDLVGHQRAFVERLEEMRLRGIVLDADVARVAGHVRRLAYVSGHAEEMAASNAADIAALSDVVASLAELVDACRSRLDAHQRLLDVHSAELAEHARILADHAQALADHDERITSGELWQSSEDFFEQTVGLWLDGRTYADLPWICQIVLLSQEVWTGACGHFELRAGAASPSRESWAKFRPKLSRAILSDPRSKGRWDGRRPVPAILDDLVGEVRDADQAMMVAEILGVGLVPEFATEQGPLSAALSMALDLSSRDGDARRPKPGVEAFSRARELVWMPGTISVDGLVRRLVDEQATAQLAARHDLQRGVSPKTSQ